MIRLAKILVPVDFSDYSRSAVQYGCELAKKFSAEVTFIHVVEDIYPLIADPGMMLATPVDLTRQFREGAEKGLQTFIPAEWLEGLSVKREVLTGTPFLEIVRYAREQQFDLIVITTHGRSGLAHVLMGSVAEKIVRKSTCPVLTVRPEGHNFVMP